ncbi:TIGR00341 family protein [bacterium]|nr:TIGR00341 family protein [bacterium]
MSLRMVELVTPATDGREEVTRLEEELPIIGIWREPLDNDLSLLRVLVRSESSESVLNELETRYGHTPNFRLVIFEVEATLPPPVVEKPEPHEDAEESKEEPPRDPHRIAVAELVQKLSESAVANRIFFVTVLLSTILATIGLVRDNVAVIIGAMVIAPLLGPNMTLALGTTLGDTKLVRNSLRVNAIGFAIALAMAAIVGAVLPFDASLREIDSRTYVGLSDVVLALAAGSVGALAFTTGLSSALVGVMVAVALLPPLATTGLLAGAGNWQGAMGALLLTTINVVCINLAGVATFLWQGVRPRHWWESERAKRMTRWAATLWAVMLAVLVLLIYVARE